MQIVANYANQSDIATSGAVTELRGVFLLSLTLFAGTVSGIAIPVGFFVVLFLDSLQNSSMESAVASYGTIGWVIIVEFTLFLGIFATAIVVLISVIGVNFLRIWTNCWNFRSIVDLYAQRHSVQLSNFHRLSDFQTTNFLYVPDSRFLDMLGVLIRILCTACRNCGSSWYNRFSGRRT